MTHPFRGRSRTYQALFLLAGVLVLALLVAEGLNTGFVPTAAATTVTGGLCVVVLFVRPARFPLAVGCAVAASLALSVAELQLPQHLRPENTPGLAELCALLLMIARTVRLQSLLRVIALGSAASVAALLLLLRIPVTESSKVLAIEVPVLLFALVLMVMLGLYLRRVDILRDREWKLAEQAARQAERLEHARELHDFVAHHVTAIVTQAKAARYVTSAGQALAPTDLDGVLAGIEKAGSQAMESMRGMVSMLRTPGDPAATRTGGDLTRVRDLVETFSAAGQSARLTLDPRLAELSLPPEVNITVHRLVQESLTNIRKYADTAAHVTVDIRLRADDPGLLDVSVTNDGRTAGRTAHRTRTGAYDRPETDRRGAGATGQPTPGRQHGYGLIGLSERVEALGGHFTAGPRPGCPGWEVIAGIPLPSLTPGEPPIDQATGSPTTSATMTP
ncbi:sensor histidine kinase [Streptomyces sp. NPDC058773]|uniref:sensor histidine kinase n=1 Tax=Streptomyces sp. NPDC058773 TaxID=3346632 RepID=UPI0036AD76FF